MKSIFKYTQSYGQEKRGFLSVISLLLVSTATLHAQTPTDAAAQTAAGNNEGLFWAISLTAILGLAVIIILLARVLLVIVTNRNKSDEAAVADSSEKQKNLTSLLLPLFATLSLFLAGGQQDVFAWQTTATDTAVPASNFMVQYGTHILALIVVFVEFVIILYLVSIIYKVLYEFKYLRKMPKAKSRWQSWWEEANALRPIEREAEVMTDHEYDGIRELDNNLPPWWIYGFYLTIAFSAVYLLNYHVMGVSPSSLQEYKNELAYAEEMKLAMQKTAGVVQIDENKVERLTDPGAIAKGQAKFKSLCSPCHGQSGEGLAGPNLTDDYWIHGGGIVNIYKIIKNGVVEKGMAAWGKQISPQDIQVVASYIMTLHGTNPPNGKKPEGQIYKDTPAAAATPADTTQQSAKADTTAATNNK